ncbi:hypothetical protein M404DRAFT_1004247 [Pisolithus tinctorius Marx 270]|uniref:Uncharacterized protein n=1 Tax=Pisolithus tinctorius Marx 270 TaxID=870435 RepID=A0A0C3NX92_PISTI|nr:hypothetical protein M404DRAFT_1004247 [Pisolithus tinctorius Marx 270]
MTSGSTIYEVTTYVRVATQIERVCAQEHPVRGQLWVFVRPLDLGLAHLRADPLSEMPDRGYLNCCP